MHNYEIKSVFSFPHKKGDCVQPHVHCNYEIVFYEKGSGIITIGSEEAEFKGASLHIVPPNCEHSEIYYEDCNVIFCELSTNDLDFTEGRKIFLCNLKNHDLFWGIVKTLKLIMQNKKDNAFMTEQSEVLTLQLKNIIKLSEESKSQYLKSIAEIARKYISNNYNKNINFELLAENIGYSYDRFRHIFIQITGVSLKKYQMGVRMSFAKKYLSNNNLKVQEIAKKCGFSSYERFALWFNQKTGMSPSQYRKGMKGVFPANIYNSLQV